jgi:hypothetical protein
VSGSAHTHTRARACGEISIPRSLHTQTPPQAVSCKGGAVLMVACPVRQSPALACRPRTGNNVVFKNSTFVLSEEEYSYMLIWTAVTTVQLPILSSIAAAKLKVNFEVEVGTEL